MRLFIKQNVLCNVLSYLLKTGWEINKVGFTQNLSALNTK